MEVSLNPCCNGIWSQTSIILYGFKRTQSLNPCCNGIWSQTYNESECSFITTFVLILVVMEYGLRLV